VLSRLIGRLANLLAKITRSKPLFSSTYLRTRCFKFGSRKSCSPVEQMAAQAILFRAKKNYFPVACRSAMTWILPVGATLAVAVMPDPSSAVDY
jgi:hypothetical protein